MLPRERFTLNPVHHEKPDIAEASLENLGDEPLDTETIYNLWKAEILTKQWHNHCNTLRLQLASGYRPPAARLSLT